MEPLTSESKERAATARRARELLAEHQRNIHVRSDRLFAGLLVLQWLFAIGVALWLSPHQWAGVIRQTHVHVLAALLLGSVIVVFPVLMVLLRPGGVATRHVVGAGAGVGDVTLEQERSERRVVGRDRSTARATRQRGPCRRSSGRAALVGEAPPRPQSLAEPLGLSPARAVVRARGRRNLQGNHAEQGATAARDADAEHAG